MRLNYLLFLFLLLSANSIYGQSKTFVRDYTYRASDSDSKISSRKQALKEVKALLIEELGIYVESYVNYEVEDVNGKLTKDFFTNEIKTFSAGTTETEIIEEEWDGYTYYIKAEITADPEEVIRRINENLSVRKKSMVIDSLYALLEYSDVELNEKSNQLEELESKLDSANTKLNYQISSLSKAKSELQTLKTQLEEYQREEKEVNDEIEAIRQKVLAQGSKARNFVRIGMTKEEIMDNLGVELYGKRRLGERARMGLGFEKATRYGGYDVWSEFFYALGDIWIHFSIESGLVDGVWENDKMELIKHGSNSNRRYLMKKYNIGKKLY